jgi:Holliday junction resolvasome RuvABC endonuclease subunit
VLYVRSLAIDHGSNRFGWSLFENGEYLDSGFEQIAETYPQSLLVFNNHIERMCGKFCPQVMVIEEQVLVQNVTSSKVLFELNGIQKLFCMLKDLPFQGYNNMEWKGVLGMAGCLKHEIGMYLALELGIDFNRICQPIYYKRDTKTAKKGDFKEYLCDESDAVGLNLAYSIRAGLRRVKQ